MLTASSVRRLRASAWFSHGQVEVPPPAPDVVPLPPSPHPGPPAQDRPPEIIEPPLPGEHVPVRDPYVPTEGTASQAARPRGTLAADRRRP